MIDGLIGEKISPRIRPDKIELRQSDLLCPVRDVVKCKNVLIPVEALTPKREYRITKMECVLRCIGMKSRLGFSHSNEVQQRIEDDAVRQFGIGKSRL